MCGTGIVKMLYFAGK